MRLLPDSVDFRNRRRRIRRLFENITMPFYSRYCRWSSMVSDQHKNSFLSAEFKQRLGNIDQADWLKSHTALPAKMELVDRLMAIDIKTNLANDLLVKVDIASMLNSLEGRSPFLDQEVMQFAARLPGNFKLRRMTKKYILKKGLKKLLPLTNVHLPKAGFGVPVGRWMRQELKDYTRDILLSRRALKREYFNPQGLKSYVNQHLNGSQDHTSGMWTLLMLELWQQKFID